MEKIKNIRLSPDAQIVFYTSGTLTLDLKKKTTFIITLNANLSTLVINNPILGKTYDFIFIQDVTGGRTVTFPAELDVSGEINSGSEEVTVLQALCYSSSSLKGGTADGSGTGTTILKANETEAVDAIEDTKYLTPNKGYLGWLSWVVSKTVSALNTTSKNIVGAINELHARPGLSTTKKIQWDWTDGIEVGDHLDFIITGVTEDNEISGISSTILHIGLVYQPDGYSIVTTNFVNDTLRILDKQLSDEPDNPSISLDYNKSGISAGIDDAPFDGEIKGRQDGEWVTIGGVGAAGLFEPVQSITDVQAFDTTDSEIWKDKYALLIEDEGQFYRYDRQSVVSEALPYIIAPDTGPGRFIQDQYAQLQSKADKVGGDNQIDYTPTSPPSWLSAILTGGKALLRAALDKIIATMVEKTDFVALTDSSNTLLNCQNSYEPKLTWEVPLLATARTLTLSNVLAGSVGVIKIQKVDAANLSITLQGTGLTHAGSVDIDNKIVLVGDANSEYLISFIRIVSQINWSEIYRTK